MIPLVALCVDETSMGHPELIGLDEEKLFAQQWLRLFSSGLEARAFLRNDRMVDEVWVVSCDDIEPINLAATIKGDRSDLRVCLVSFQGTGSLLSRASAAGIDATLTQQAFVTRYAAFKRVRSAPPPPRDEPALPDVHESGPLFQPEEPVAVIPPDPRPKASRPKPSEVPTVVVDSRAIEFPMAPNASADALLLPIVSGSGGAGKSTVAVLLALLAQRRGFKTLLLDFDLQFGDVRELVGMPDTLGIDDVLADPARLAQLAPSAGMPAVLGSPRHLEEAESIAQRASALLDALKGMFDIVVVNTGAAWAEQHAVLLERCSKALFLIDQRGSSIAACRRALDLCARCGIAVGPFLFALNFCAKGTPLTSIDVSCALRGAQTIELADGGAEVEEVMSEGRPMDLIEAGNPLARSLDGFLAGILPSSGEDAGSADAPLAGKPRRKRRRRRKKVFS